MSKMSLQLQVLLICMVAVTTVISARLQGASGWDNSPDAQYHIQTDEGPERYFRYQTTSGQYRKEKRLEDGSVVGTYGWIDPNGFLRLRDYVADNTGYRVVRTKMLFVGKDDPIADAVAKSKKVPSQGGTGVQTNALTPTTAAPPATTTQAPTPTPISSYPYPQPEVSSNALPYTPSYLDPNVAPFYFNQPYVGAASNRRDYQVPYQGYPVYQQPQQQQQQQQQPAPYDGISTTANGFRYYLPRHYHEEETAGDTRAGSFGYIDPFGIRRVVYYNSAPDTGFVHKKNNRYVGFNATPYDPRF